MKNILKILAVSLIAVLSLACLPRITAKADTNMNIVYATVPEDWENPCVWAWDADGNNAFEAWPGGAMIADENNEGWYYIYVSEEMTNVIINANEGSVQTSDFSTDGANAWFTVKGPEEVEMSSEQQTTGDLPEYVPTFKVYAKVDESWIDPCLWAWSAPDGTNLFANWPGEGMTSNTDGFYSMEVPEWVNSIIVNGNAGTVQTADISVEPNDLWLVIDAEGNYEMFNEKPAASAEDMITVHVKAPSDWLLPSLWAWSAPDGTNAFANWPGEEFEEDGEWYVKEVPNWINSVIVNGNLGTVQTSDISVEAGKDIWVVVKGAEEYELYYEEPAATELESTTENIEEVSEVIETETEVVGATPTEEVNEKPGVSGGAIAGIIGGVAVLGGGITAGVVSSKKKNKSA